MPNSILRFVTAAGFALLLSGCANQTTDNSVNDPFETTNRELFAFNQTVDRHVLLPTAKAYVAVVPDFARDGVHNFLTNLNAPVVLANDVLQGEMRHASQTTGRFLMNSTVGIGGLLDPASNAGLPLHTEDFGLTLASYGVGEGSYLVVPLLGPSPPRDLGGQVVDIFLDPTTYIGLREHIYYSLGREALTVVDLRARNIDTLDGIERSSVDYYAAVRSLYRQSRDSANRDGKPDSQTLPNF